MYIFYYISLCIFIYILTYSRNKLIRWFSSIRRFNSIQQFFNIYIPIYIYIDNFCILCFVFFIYFVSFVISYIICILYILCIYIFGICCISCIILPYMRIYMYVYPTSFSKIILRGQFLARRTRFEVTKSVCCSDAWV